MRFAIHSWIWLLLLGGLSCQGNHRDQAESDRDRGFRFRETMVEKTSKKCGLDSARCTRAVAYFPQVSGGEEVVRNHINEIIQRNVARLLEPLEADSSSVSDELSPILAASHFVALYDEYLLDAPEYDQSWSAEVTSEIIFRNPRIVTIKLESYTYTGGAHPNSVVDLINIDLDNGRVLSLSDLVTDKTELIRLAKSYFRKTRALEEGTSLNEEGFFWDGAFVLPREIGITEQGLYLFYNSYEAAPYAAGTTEFVIPFNELMPILARPGMLGLD